MGISYSTPATASSNAGTYSHLGSRVAQRSNYAIVTDATGTFIVNKAGLTVSATGSQTYGGANATLTPTYSRPRQR